jgi:hypothetical protein
MSPICILLAASAAVAACSAPAAVAGDGAAAVRAPSLAAVDVLDRTTGERLPVYWHDGQRWIAGAPGHRYAIAVRNQTGGRVLAVVSVDGVNVVSGETAGWDQRGYVFSSWESYEILGWRKSQERVADFEFAALGDSYAARTGRPEHVGVIGVAVFQEAVRPAIGRAQTAPPAAPPEGAPSERSDAGAEARSPEAASTGEALSREKSAAERRPGRSLAETQRLGTAHGQSESSWVALTDFERARSQPDETITIRYDRRDRLVALGIIPGAQQPRPFPQSADAGYVPDPPARR